MAEKQRVARKEQIAGEKRPKEYESPETSQISTIERVKTDSEFSIPEFSR